MARYFLGSHQESLHFQLLTGLKFQQNCTDYFWPTFFSINFFFTIVALFIIVIRNWIGRYKEWKLTQNVQINLPEVISIADQNEENTNEPCPYYNNVKYNISLLDGKEMAIVITVFFVSMLFFHSIEQWASHNLDGDDRMSLFKWKVFTEFFITMSTVFNPVTYFFAKKILLK